MQKLTPKQERVAQQISRLLGVTLDVRPFKKSVFFVRLPEGDRCESSQLFAQIERVVTQYKLGRVETNGVNALAVL